MKSLMAMSIVAGLSLALAALAAPAGAMPDSPFDANLGVGFTSPVYNIDAVAGGARVNTVVVQPNGKLVVGGYFDSFNEDTHIPPSLLRLNANGTPDTAFNTNVGTRIGTAFDAGSAVDGEVYSVAIQPDGKLVVVGAFGRGNASAPYGILRLNADGTPDTAFNTRLGTGVRWANAVAVQPNGKILVGGGFTSLNGRAGVPDDLIRLNADGTPDPTFNTHLGRGFDDPYDGGHVYSLAVQPDGKILVGGWFSILNGRTTIPSNLLRLMPDGTLDASFAATLGRGFDYPVHAVALQSNGKIVAGGDFSSIYGRPTIPHGFLRLNANGTPDATFNANLGTGFSPTSSVAAITVQPDGRILVGGQFTGFHGGAGIPHALMRFNASGLADASFNAGLGAGFRGTGVYIGEGITSPGESVNAIATRADGRIVVGGQFTTLRGDASVPDNLLGLLSSPGNVLRPAVTFPAAGRAAVTWAPPLRTGGTPITNNQYCLSACTVASHWRVTLPAGARQVTLTGLVRGRSYTLQVRAVNAAGLGPVAATTFTQAR